MSTLTSTRCLTAADLKKNLQDIQDNSVAPILMRYGHHMFFKFIDGTKRAWLPQHAPAHESRQEEHGTRFTVNIGLARGPKTVGRDCPTGIVQQKEGCMRIVRMSHPEPDGPPDRMPVQVGEVWENPVTRERVTILERPWDDAVGRATAELTALVGARVSGEHYHPGLVEQFTVLEGELTVKRDGQTSILHQGETAVIRPGSWHDWWNAGDRDALVRVEVTPGERFLHMLETFFGLARLGHTDGKGMPSLLQLALITREFSDAIVFRSPPLVVQRAIFGALAPIARWLGYRATYPQLSRIVLAPRTQRKP
jgi:mannose-6-phosphate isomerase-like protein (cupin superfamily)